MHEVDSDLIEARELRGFFHDSVLDALGRQKLDAAAETVMYLVNLLAEFARSENIFHWTPEGYRLHPLAVEMIEAMQAVHDAQRCAALQRVGDVALFVTGFFNDSLIRRSIDARYYIALGGTAYGALAQCVRERGIRGRTLGRVFDELSRHFPEFVDVITDVGEQSPLDSDADIMRAYSMWLKTGSPRAARQLRAAGVQLDPGSDPGTAH